jgi:hypothetical protein
MRKEQKNDKITSKKVTNLHKQIAVFVNMSMFQQTVLAAQTHLSEGLALKVQSTEKVGKSLTDIDEMHKVN